MTQTRSYRWEFWVEMSTQLEIFKSAWASRAKVYTFEENIALPSFSRSCRNQRRTWVIYESLHSLLIWWNRHSLTLVDTKLTWKHKTHKSFFLLASSHFWKIFDSHSRLLCTFILFSSRRRSGCEIFHQQLYKQHRFEVWRSSQWKDVPNQRGH